MSPLVRIKKLYNDAKMPVRATQEASAVDLHCHSVVKNDKEDLWIAIGLAMEIPFGYEGKIFPRSSISNYPLVLANSVGIVDSDYRGEIQVRFKKLKQWGFEDYLIKGAAIAQLKIEPVILPLFTEVDDLSSTERGEGGFGSTGL